MFPEYHTPTRAGVGTSGKQCLQDPECIESGVVIDKDGIGKSQRETYVVQALNELSYLVVVKGWNVIPELFLTERTGNLAGKFHRRPAEGAELECDERGRKVRLRAFFRILEDPTCIAKTWVIISESEHLQLTVFQVITLLLESRSMIVALVGVWDNFWSVVIEVWLLPSRLHGDPMSRPWLFERFGNDRLGFFL